MPTKNETVPNRPLAGHELRNILINDFTKMLDSDGMFQPHMGYSRVAYEISYRLQLDNPLFPEHKGKRVSRDPARNIPPNDIVKKIEAPPLKGDTNNVETVGLKRERVIDSPNKARLENGLPVTINKINRQTGATEEKQVQYDTEGIQPTEAKDTDISNQAERDWGTT